MKTPFLLRTSLVCALALSIASFSPAFAIPTLAAPAAAVAPALKSVAMQGADLPDKNMPKEVRALMPRGAKTTKLARFPIGAKSSPILLHAWKVERDSANGNAPALFCIDLFSRSTAGPWELVSSTVYTHEEFGYPPSYTTRWLHPKTRQGIVIVEETTGSTGSTLRLITLPEGLPSDSSSERDVHSVEKFFTQSSGGESVFIDFGVDSSGTMTVEKTVSPHAVVPSTLTTFAWRNQHWIQVSSKPFTPK